MTVRAFNFGKDYPTVCEWWRVRGFPIPMRQALPKYGFVVEDVAAVWVYLSDSTLAWVEFLVTNPKAAPREAATAINALIDHIKAEAKTVGVEALFTTTERASLVRLFERQGFSAKETNMTNLMLRVKP